MDRTVPAGAALLLGFIYETETSAKAPACYDVIYGNRQHGLATPLTAMTLAEVQAAQLTWSTRAWAARFGSSKASSAAGAPQLMRATLGELIAQLKLDPRQKLDADLQDRLGYQLLKKRGYAEFMAGTISRTEFGKRLAQEWASFPVLAATRGGTKANGVFRTVQRGQSYYAGDGLNKALVAPETIEALLDKVRVAAAVLPAPDAPAPATPNAPGVAPAPAAAPLGFFGWLKSFFA
jgi:muramidase (phage lysozyme)